MTCRDCPAPIGPKNESGLCARCYTRDYKAKHRRGSRRNRERAARLEDLTFMAECGETFEGAAKRLGITESALEKWGRDHAPELLRRLRRNGERWVA